MIIAEIGQAHEGSLGIAHSYIESLSKVGVDAIKFQMHFADYESSLFEKFRIPISSQYNSRFDYWKKMQFSTEQWKELKEHCDSKNIMFLCTPFTLYSVDILEQLNVEYYKISSGDVNNFLLLEKICQTNKPIILSTGMSSMNEITKTVNFISNYHKNISLMQCTSMYPTLPQNWGLNMIRELRQKFNLPIGYSDHSGNIYASISALALGAEIIEIHAIFHKNLFGPDASSSLTIEQIGEIVKANKQIKLALQNPIDKSITDELKQMKDLFEKSLSVNQNIAKGTVILFDMLECKKPKKGILANEYKSVIGKKTNKNINQFSFLQYDDLEK